MQANRQNQIKVFKPNSKQADFTVRSVTPEAGAKALGDKMDPEAASRALRGFKTLKAMQADSLSFRHGDRKVKIELAKPLEAA